MTAKESREIARLMRLAGFIEIDRDGNKRQGFAVSGLDPALRRWLHGTDYQLLRWNLTQSQDKEGLEWAAEIGALLK